MECKTIHKNLIFYLEGELPDSKMQEIKSHLDSCQSCAAFAEDLKSTLGIIGQEKQQEVNPFFYTRVKAKLENRAAETAQVIAKPVFARILQPVAFSLLLLIGIYSGIKIGQPASTKQYTATLMQNQEIPLLNEMTTESIETSLME